MCRRDSQPAIRKHYGGLGIGALALLLALVALGLVCAARSDAAGLEPRAAVEAAARAQAAAFVAGELPQLWASYSPRFRSTCRYDAWVLSVRAARASLRSASPRFVFVDAAIHGRRATIAYVWVFHGKATLYQGDTMIEVGGKWFDDLDAVTTCAG